MGQCPWAPQTADVQRANEGMPPPSLVQREGKSQIERYGIPHTQHGARHAARSVAQRESTSDVGISSSWLIAKFWGLVGECAVALIAPTALIASTALPASEGARAM
jgi:poly(3-hydroxybutyrate) depolymerase